MIISLGRQLPGASSDLPGSRNGSGRSARDCLHKGQHSNLFPSSIQSALLLYLILLPVGFAEPSRSPGLLVSSYLAVSPLPQLERLALPPRRFIFCGTFPVRAAHRAPDGGYYPPPRPMESGLSSVACPLTQAAVLVSRPCSLSPGAAAIIAPATNLHFIIRKRPPRDNRDGYQRTQTDIAAPVCSRRSAPVEMGASG